MTSPETPALRYEIRVLDLAAHLLEVRVTLAVRGPGGALPPDVTFFMPVWTPGSYLVREYARHVEGVKAEVADRPAAARKVRKNAWAVETGGVRSVSLRYRVYSNDLSVRTNHVDLSHAYWNGAATYLLPEGHEGPAEVSVELPAGWLAGTALSRSGALESGAGQTFLAASIDELIDSPFECGPMKERGFRVLEREHSLFVWASRHEGAVDWPRLEADIRRIVETEARLLAGDEPPEQALPYERYAFLWHVSPRGRGGLEHGSCCSLLTSPALFQTRSGYLDALSLVAHEFLHLWNVKRIRPAGLVPHRYEHENYTRLLWWFEGGTSYFDWRVLRLSGLCTAREYAEHLASECARLAETPGARVHSLEEASFDAWIKAYRPDENSVNTTVSYYLKGEVVCALLDIEIRVRSGGARSLDDVLRHLWRAYGREGRPVPEHGMLEVFEQASGVALGDRFEAWVRSSDPVDPAPVLAKMGLVHERRPQPRKAPGSLGVKLRTRSGRPVVESVLRGSPARGAGLDHGDEIIAVAGRRVDDGVEGALAGLSPGAAVEVLFSRDGLTEACTVVLGPPLLSEGRLVVSADAGPDELARLEAWLGPGAAESLRGGA